MKVKSERKSLSCVQLWVTPRTAAHQAPPSMGFSWQEYWSRVPLPSPFLFISLLKFHLQISPSLLNPLSKISVPFFFFLPLSLFNFWPVCTACRILVPQPGIEPGATAVKAPSPNPEPPGNSPNQCFYYSDLSISFKELITIFNYYIHFLTLFLNRIQSPC